MFRVVANPAPGWARHVRRAATAGFLCVFLLAPVLAQDDEEAEDEIDPDEMVVPPGQESLLAQMLGGQAPLPNGCRLTGAGADGPGIEATYDCSGATVVLELAHSSEALPTDTVTEHFAIAVKSGPAPDGLRDAVAFLVRAQEGGFKWTRVEDTAPNGNEGEEAP